MHDQASYDVVLTDAGMTAAARPAVWTVQADDVSTAAKTYARIVRAVAAAVLKDVLGAEHDSLAAQILSTLNSFATDE